MRWYELNLGLMTVIFVAAVFFSNAPWSLERSSGIACATTGNHILLLEIKGPVGPALSDYLQQGFEEARANAAVAVIITMDTPGGLDFAMRDIIQAILTSPVPVMTYVSPDGARAASAGTYILYASHIAAMAPATNLGAATPIRIGGLPEIGKNPSESEDQTEEQPHEDTLQRKIVNDAAAYLRALAERHGRNVEWAEKAVREAVSLTATEALERGVIDLVASDLADLLQQAEGRLVNMERGQHALHVKNLPIEHYTPDWRTRILLVITDPNIAYILLLLGAYGLFFELANPGAILPGVIGIICLLLALYTFHILPVNYAGVALIILGLAFMVTEAFLPSFGALGIGGLIAFAVGSLILFDEESMRISLPLITGTALCSLAFFTAILGRAYTVSRKKVRTGVEEMLGSTGTAMDDFSGFGRAWIHGESWSVVSALPVKKGQKVKVLSSEGLLLTVEPMEEL